MNALSVDDGIQGSGGPYVPEGFSPVFADSGYCGASFNEGLIRFHDSETGPRYRAHVKAAFPDLEDGADVLAFDWQGRQIVTRPGHESMWIADPATGELSEFLTLDEFANVLALDAGRLAFDGERFDT